MKGGRGRGIPGEEELLPGEWGLWLHAWTPAGRPASHGCVLGERPHLRNGVSPFTKCPVANLPLSQDKGRGPKGAFVFSATG